MNAKVSTRAADGLCLVGGGALLCSTFVYWVREGAGSRLRGHELIDTLVSLGNSFPGASAARLTVLWYLVPALGAATWLTVGLTDARSRATRAIAIATIVVVAIVVMAFVRLAGRSDLGLGPWLAILGAAAICVGAWSRRPE